MSTALMPVRDRLGDVRMQVPFSMLCEKQALTNHNGQDLATLAGRGGLSCDEATALMERRRFARMPDGESSAFIAAALAR